MRLDGKELILGVTGSIAAYKAVDVLEASCLNGEGLERLKKELFQCFEHKFFVHKNLRTP